MNYALLLSGGVDSSVALAELKQQGHQITAYYLKIWLEDEFQYLGDCPWEEDLRYAQGVCDQLGVALEVISLQREYWDRVVSYAIAEVKAGRTPNPDMFCNRRIKFGAFFDRVNLDAYDRIASGHYARVDRSGPTPKLMTAPDPIKDQTYFLAYLKPEQLARLDFPIGVYQKEEVRSLAKQYDLPTQNRPDSQGICFLGKIPYDEFLKQHLGEQTGELIELETGEVKGTHQGYWYYTIGQRRGIRLHGGPWFVVDKDIDQNIVYISRAYHSEEKHRDHFTLGELNWVSGTVPTAGSYLVKVRHGPESYLAQVSWIDDQTLHIQLPTNDQGLAPGQFAVLYDGEMCLGGGVIQ